MKQEEFREHLFDVINESDELIIRDIEVSWGDIHVTVEDGSRFVVSCRGR